MKRIIFYPSLINIIVLLIVVLLSSCGAGKMLQSSNKEISAYTAKSNAAKIKFGDYEYVIKQDDKLSLSVWNNDDLSVGSLFGIYNSNEVYGKWILVDKEGFGIFPSIGKIQVGGLTARQASLKLEKIYAKEVKSPIVVVKVLNMQVTILGEVRNAGNFIVEKQNNSLFEIIGKAGGTNYYADVRKITIQRGNPNNPEIFKVNLSKLKNIPNSQILLLPDDVVYIPSRNRQQFEKEMGTYVGLTSVLATLYIILKK